MRVLKGVGWRKIEAEPLDNRLDTCRAREGGFKVFYGFIRRKTARIKLADTLTAAGGIGRSFSHAKDQLFTGKMQKNHPGHSGNRLLMGKSAPNPCVH